MYSGMNEFKKGYQPRTYLAKYENSDLLVDSHNILNRWKNYLCQLLNAHGVNDGRQTEMHTAEPLGPRHSFFEVGIIIENMKGYKSPGTEQILAELIQAGGNTLWYEICKLINSIWNKQELPQQWKESIIVPIYKRGDKSDCSYYRGISMLPIIYKILSDILVS
jgi:hypothetical protein